MLHGQNRKQGGKGSFNVAPGEHARKESSYHHHEECMKRPNQRISSILYGEYKKKFFFWLHQRYDFWYLARAPGPPNFLGSARRLSATNKVRSY